MPTTAPLLPERRRARRDGVSVAQALGSTTRAGIFDHLQEVGEPRTVRDVAQLFDLHPNVARTHLELLADAGLVTVGRRKHPGGGRPAKVYAARDEAAAAVAAEPARAATDGLVVRLLVGLLESGAGPASSQGARAHEVAVAEGRRLATRGGSRVTIRSEVVADAAAVAVAALRPVSPGARVLRAGADFADVVGVRSGLAALTEIRPALVEPFERGLLAGALAAAGVPVSVAEAAPETPGVAGGEPALRVRPITQVGRGHLAAPAGSVDARGGQREAGVVRAMRAVTSLHVGDILEVLAEGPGSPAAFARWADRAGHELLGVERATDATGRPAIRLLIRKGVVA